MSMGYIDDELDEVSKLCENVVEGSRLVSCISTLVRVEITRTAFKKIIICIQFRENYPKEPLLIELKSKTLSTNLLIRLTEVCENECKKLLGRSQILPILKFIKNFIDENPLICCYDEISSLKRLLRDCDTLKLKQKTSSIILEVHEGLYFYKVKLEVPDDYPNTVVRISEVDTNFPPILARYLTNQSQELGRRCVEPPLKKQSNQRFTPSPSLNPVASFLIRTVKILPNEKCQQCKNICLPNDPKDIVTAEKADLHVERLYCGHIFHLKCLLIYMKTPPFHGGKKCQQCGQRIYHDKWGISDKLAEDRWAHQQARARELSEVVDFFS